MTESTFRVVWTSILSGINVRRAEYHQWQCRRHANKIQEIAGATVRLLPEDERRRVIASVAAKGNR